MKKIQKEFPFNLFKEIISSLEKQKIKYFVFGGFCYLGLGEKWKRKDLDLVCFEKNKEEIISLFRKRGCSVSEIGRKISFRKGRFDIEIRFIRIEKGIYKIRSNRTIDHLSPCAFLRNNYGVIRGFKFRIVPNEFLALYRKGHIENNPQKNKELNKIIDKIKPKCKKLKIYKQIRFRKTFDKFLSKK